MLSIIFIPLRPKMHSLVVGLRPSDRGRLVFLPGASGLGDYDLHFMFGGILEGGVIVS